MEKRSQGSWKVLEFVSKSGNLEKAGEARSECVRIKHWRLWPLHCMFLGLRLQGADCINNALKLSSAVKTDLPLISLKWVRWVVYLYICTTLHCASSK